MTSRLPLPAVRESVTAQAVATGSLEQVLRRLDSSVDGLSSAQVWERLAHYEPNAIRTHRVSAWAVSAGADRCRDCGVGDPILRSGPGTVLMVTLMSVDVIGIVLTVTPLGHKPGFAPLPWQFYTALAVFIIVYLVLVEATKKVFYSEPIRIFGQPYRTGGLRHLIERRAARLIHSGGPPFHRALTRSGSEIGAK
jgi:hypothetical protein